jgi:hypothetical protein
MSPLLVSGPRRVGAATAVWLLLGVAAYVPAAGAAEGSCANPTPVWGLPDCRAYELVTPPYKEGAPVQALSGEFALSSDGTRMIGTSVGAFAGSEEGELNFSSRLEGTAYEFSRTATGWQPSALGPPESRYVDAGMYDVSANLEGTLWGLGTLTQPAGVSDLYLERPRGSFAEVGPPTPSPSLVNVGKYSYLGASADLSHVLFSTEPGYRWPFDSTVGSGSTLYEYVGTGNSAPSLVGVSGGAGNTELVSQCGTLLGSGASGSVYNAVSASGERVFFTAVGKDDHECGGQQPPVDELLAREAGPSGEAQTVAVSEPTLAYCSASPSPPCADAHFEGASQDGAEVFFSSTQKLLPEAGEGTMNLYEYDFEAPAGERLALASSGGASAEVQGVARICEDGSHVYFVAKGVLSTTANSAGVFAVEGADNLYVYERDALFPAGRTSFIATLSAGDEADWAQADDRPVLASEGGRYLVFTSQADLLDEGLAPGVAQVFQYDAQTDTLVRASIGKEGADDDGKLPLYGATLATQQANLFDSPTTAVSLSAPEDGAVFFASATPLAPNVVGSQTDTLGEPAPNVYEYRAGSVYLISDGIDSSALDGGPSVRLLGSDPSGGDVLFTTVDRLSTQDSDTQQDIYDARAEGGFSTSTPPSCSGEYCRWPPSPPPPPLYVAPSAAPAGQAARAKPDSEPPQLGITGFTMQALNSKDAPVTQAGAHPQSLTTSFDFTTTGTGVSERPVEGVKDVVLDLPAGLAVDARAAPRCRLYELLLTAQQSGCPPESQIGTLGLHLAGEESSRSGGQGGTATALYNMTPEAGYLLEFGAVAGGRPILIYGSVVRTGSGYGLRLDVPGVTGPGVIGASLTLFGDPAQGNGGEASGVLLTNPSHCAGGPLTAELEVDTWQHPGQYDATEAVVYPNVEGCQRLPFNPTLSVVPDAAEADEPTGYQLKIDIPQSESPGGLATSELRRATVTLPAGVSISLSGLDGVAGCAATGPEGIDIGSADLGAGDQDLGNPEASEVGSDGLYHTAPGHCPQAATVGNAEIVTPLLGTPLEGRLFLACTSAGRAGCSGAGAGELGLYLEASDAGVIVKLAIQVSLNQATGQVTLSFDELPQLPIGELKLDLWGGPQALLASPQTCGVASASSDLSPWSALTDVESQSSFSVNLGAENEPCPSVPPFEPSVNAGVTTPSAGSYSALVLQIDRASDQQYLARFTVQLPPGLGWMFASVPPCGEPRAAAGTCASASAIGVTQIAVGAGPYPLWLFGRVYLTEGYRGAPFGLSVVVPITAGPLDLATVVLRAAIGVDPGTGALTITSDPLPQIVDGIPLRMKTLEVAINHREFVLNPTICATRQITATLEGAEGASVQATDPLVTPGCQNPPGGPPNTSVTPTGTGTAPTGTAPTGTAPDQQSAKPRTALKPSKKTRAKHRRRRKHRRGRPRKREKRKRRG